MSNPCNRCDITDGDYGDVTDRGCCTPYPVKIPCGAPVISPECDEVGVMEYDEETEEFSLVSAIYDENCDAILDQNSDTITSIIP